MASCFKNLSRRKRLITFHEAKHGLRKSMGIYDLIFLGVGSTLGVGIYILSGTVAKNYAGPAIIISFFLAAVITLLAGICYAEFGACAPTSGSIYSYSYITLGEFVAFIMGWNLITQYIIGAASVIKAVSVYTDSYLNNTIQTHLRSVYAINFPYLSEYFDVVAFLLAIGIAVLLSFGLQESMKLNAVLTSVNVILVLFFVLVGLCKVNLENWSLPADTVPKFAGEGGFMPYGIEGIIKGANVCLYGFIGFDCIATTGEEVERPARTLPIAVIVSLAVSFLAYFSLSTVLTLLVPYYLQDETAPLVFAFSYSGLSWAEWIVRIGSFFGLCACLFGAFFPISRIIYAMAQDGLLFKILGKVHKKYETPVIATIFSGLVTGITAAVLDVNDLINLNSIGTLLSYSIVALCVIILRYSVDNCSVDEKKSLLTYSNEPSTLGDNNQNPESQPKNVISVPVTTIMIIFCALAVLFSLIVGIDFRFKLPIITVTSIAMISALFFIYKQPSCEERLQLPFKVPLVPFIPALSIFCNIYFMMQFDAFTWVRFWFWLVLGLVVYFSYGVFHSNERQRKKVYFTL